MQPGDHQPKEQEESQRVDQAGAGGAPVKGEAEQRQHETSAHPGSGFQAAW